MTRFLRRLIWKELYELARQPWVLLCVFVVPLYLLFTAITLVGEVAPVRVVISYPETADEALRAKADSIAKIEGIAAIVVPGSKSINALMAEKGAALGVLLSEQAKPEFVERSITNYGRRLNFEVAIRIRGELDGVDPRMVAALDSFIESSGVGTDLRHLSVLSNSDSVVFLPRGLAMITVSVTIVLAARSILRELENQTLPLLITSPGGSWALVAVAKMIFVLWLSTSVFAFLLLTMNPMFGIFIKPGIAPIFATQVLAVLATASVGFSLALLGRSTVQAYLLVSVYLVANLVLTGFLSPVDTLPSSSDPILKLLLPLTFLRPIYEGWLLFGDPVGWRDVNVMWLVAHTIGGMVLLGAVVRVQQGRF